MTTTPSHEDTLEKARLANEAGCSVPLSVPLPSGLLEVGLCCKSCRMESPQQAGNAWKVWVFVARRCNTDLGSFGSDVTAKCLFFLKL